MAKKQTHPTETPNRSEGSQSSYRLTRAHMNHEDFGNLVGPHRRFLRLMEKELNVLLSVENGHLFFKPAKGEEKSNRTAFDFNLASQVVMTFEAILAQGGKLSEELILQTIRRGRGLVNELMNGSFEMSKGGHQITKTSLEPEELANSAIFEPVVMQKACPEDPEFKPVQTLVFKRDMREYLSRIRSAGQIFLQKIQEKVGGISFVPNGEKISITGEIEKVEQARKYVCAFAQEISTAGARSKNDLMRALCTVLDLSYEETQAAALAKKNSKIACTDETISLGGKFKLTINELTGRSENQRKYLNLLNDDKFKAVLVQGPAGTGKTRLFLQVALRKLAAYYSGEEMPAGSMPFNKLVLTIPLEENGQKLGALPGNERAKTMGWFDTYYNHMVRILSPLSANGRPDEAAGIKALDGLLDSEIVSIKQLGMLRGKSFDQTLFVLDEAQNATHSQILTLMTRAEDSSRVFICGDLMQCDLFNGKLYQSGRYSLPSHVRIDQKGDVWLDRSGVRIKLGQHYTIGQFQHGKKAGVIESVRPRNGFAAATLFYTASPHVGVVAMGTEDIQRGGLTCDILRLESGLRLEDARTETMLSEGKGGFDANALLAKAKEVEEPERPLNTLQIGKTAAVQGTELKQ